ncbi:anti-sigma factor domain-containing protein [Herbiconiux sp. YIM B11900]|uniref:anti-sigma factor n=1 Tax=Herbiconiux sp. YIM B11900 TaxID=3404131 RepID=UPI003F844F20
MTHIDDDALAMIALGDSGPSTAERAHLADCARCSEELAALSRAVQLGRAEDAPELVAPSADVWTRISAELGLAAETPAHPDARPSSVPASPAAQSPSVQPASPDQPPTASAAPAAPPAASAAPPAPHHVKRRRRLSGRSRIWVPLAAATVVLAVVAGAGLGVWWQTAQQSPRGIAVAGAELTPFPGWPDARGSAVVEQDPDGRHRVVVDVDPQTDAGGGSSPLREVWLIRSDGTGLVSIGFLDGPEGSFDIPDGIDLDQYSLVDISAEADDGDPTHSGDSIVRGELRAL